MTSTESAGDVYGVLVAVVGRYGSDPSEPFPPRIETRGIELPDPLLEQIVELVRTAWESTAPWEPAVDIERKATQWVGDQLRAQGLGFVEVQVIVMDDLPLTYRVPTENS